MHLMIQLNYYPFLRLWNAFTRANISLPHSSRRILGTTPILQNFKRMDLFCTFTALSGVKLAALMHMYRQKPKNAKLVGKVADINLYPIKSCRALQLQSANCTHAALQHPQIPDLLDRFVTYHSNIFTSRVSSGGNRISTVFPSFRVSVCSSVSSSALSESNRLTYGHETWHRDWHWWNLGQFRWSRS